MLLEILPSPELEEPFIPVEGGSAEGDLKLELEKRSGQRVDEHIRNLADSALRFYGQGEDAYHDISNIWAMDKLLFTGEFIKASNGENYAHPFGRDTEHVIDFTLSALQAAEGDNKDHSILESRLSPVIEQGIASLVAHIGTKDEVLNGKWRQSGQAPGKMFHEAGEIKGPLAAIAEDWQDSDEAGSNYLVNYRSVDSTPLFACIVSDYDKFVRKHKSDDVADTFLNREIPHRNGKDVLTVGEAVHMSVNWVMNELERSDLGFIEYQRRPGQEKGIRNQVMKDSLTSYVHTNGELANTYAPIASVEVQAMAYDALAGAADMFERSPKVAARQHIDNETIAKLRQIAADLRKRVIDKFWVPEQQRFAQAIDRDPTTNIPRLVETPSSNELELLNSRILHDVDPQEQRQYVSSLARQAISDEFLTDAGIRSRAKSQHSLIDFYDYHGSGTVWPVITHRVAKGLLGWGLNDAAEQVDNRAMNAINIGNGRNEYFVVDPDTDEVFYRYMTKQQADVQGHPDGKLIVATNIPEERQAWSEAAGLDIKAKHGAGTYKRLVTQHPIWAEELDREITAGVDSQPVIKDIKEIEYRRQHSPLAIVDVASGHAYDERYYRISDAGHNISKTAA